MGLTPHTAGEYEHSLQKLLPPGDFWDRQLADATSDISLWCAAKSMELARFRGRMVDLLAESYKATTSELIDNWERTLGLDNATLDLSLRKELLALDSRKKIDLAGMSEILTLYGATLDSYKFPYTPAFFGRARFLDRIAGPASFQTLYLYITLPDESYRTKLEESMESALLAQYILTFFYRQANNEYVS
jgi:hypothetical protein